MPTILKVLILAVIQGITEFLPISSSGHLVMAERLLSLESLCFISGNPLLLSGLHTVLSSASSYLKAFLCRHYDGEIDSEKFKVSKVQGRVVPKHKETVLEILLNPLEFQRSTRWIHTLDKTILVDEKN